MNSKGVKINDLLECPVCMETISSAPIFQCRNGHIVCKDCHPKLESCPICREANLYDTPMTIRNLKLEEMVKRFQLSNLETAKMMSESIQIDATVPKTPNVHGNINQETRQVAVQLNNDIIVDDDDRWRLSDCCLLLLTVVGVIVFALPVALGLHYLILASFYGIISFAILVLFVFKLTIRLPDERSF